MKKTNGKRIAIIIVALSLLIATVFSTVISAGNLLQNDSLITLSYINDVVIPEIKQSIKAEIEALVSKQSGTTYTIVELKKGQKLIAQGSLELILRQGGTATCISPAQDVGISDLTYGKEILNGKEIMQNSYCVIPRGDGRGILCTSKVAYIMVRGGYTIEK